MIKRRALSYTVRTIDGNGRSQTWGPYQDLPNVKTACEQNYALGQGVEVIENYADGSCSEPKWPGEIVKDIRRGDENPWRLGTEGTFARDELRKK